MSKHTYTPIKGGTCCRICGMARDYCGKTQKPGEYEARIRSIALEDAACEVELVLANFGPLMNLAQRTNYKNLAKRIRAMKRNV